jgi:hypothetical protein
VRVLSRIRRDEDGFTMVLAILVLLVLMTIGTSVVGAAQGDENSSSYSVAQKQSYQAAESGLGWYLSQLQSDSNYWLACTNHTVPDGSGGRMAAPLNDDVTRSPGNTETRNWRTLPGSTARYNVEFLPASGTKCDPANPTNSMVDPNTGTMRIRIDGQARPGVAPRSIIVTLRRTGFLDFIYYTDLEAMDPKLWAPGIRDSVQVAPSTTDLPTFINQACTQHWWEGRSTAKWYGTGHWSNGTAFSYPASGSGFDCSGSNIQFATFDVIAGPFHTEDSILICGNPTFGRAAPYQDKIELRAPAGQEIRKACGASDAIVNRGTYRPGAASLPLPPDNKALMRNVTFGYLFTGKTSITMNSPGNTMTVTNASLAGSPVTMPIPDGGVVYVASDDCTVSYDKNNPNGDPANCGDLSIHGTYAKSVTFGAEKDIIVDGDILRASGSDVLLGLVANNYVRVNHPACGQGTTNREIDAAILTVNDSFLVDNWGCDQLGTLTVKGAIAQKYRGVVGTNGGSGSYTGYQKNYQYDDRFKYRSPPKFLDPVRSAWQPVRVSEQVPAT